MSNPGLVEGVAIVVLVAAPVFRRQGGPRSHPAAEPPRGRSGPIAPFYGRGLTSAGLLLVALEPVPEVSQRFLPALRPIVGTSIARTVRLFASPTRPAPSADDAERRWAAAAPELIAFPGADSPPAPRTQRKPLPHRTSLRYLLPRGPGPCRRCLLGKRDGGAVVLGRSRCVPVGHTSGMYRCE